MKLLFSIKEMDDGKGGAERVLADITAGLADRGHDITLITFDQPGGVSFYPLHSNIRRICLGIGDTHQKAGLLETVLRIRAMRQFVKQVKPDLVISFMHSSFVPMALSCIGTKCPVIASEHIVPDHYAKRRFEFFLFCLSSLFIKKITVLSGAILKSYPGFLRKKMVVVPNPVKIPDSLADFQENKPAKCLILNVGRLSPQKDQETLIRAFATLHEEYPEWSLRIVGDGELRDRLQLLIDELGLSKAVSLIPARQDIATQYKEAQIFALSSVYESFGLATAEAMSYGVPPIGFADCPGTNELITSEKTGLLASGRDRVEAFAACLRRLIDSEALRLSLGRSAREDVQKYSLLSVLEIWESLIRKMVP